MLRSAPVDETRAGDLDDVYAVISPSDVSRAEQRLGNGRAGDRSRRARVMQPSA